MFAPSLNVSGRPIAFVSIKGGPLTISMQEFLESAEARVVHMSSEKHDKLMAACQAATHSAVLVFGMAMESWGQDIDELLQIAPPPHVVLLSLLARIVTGTPEVYNEIQRSNSMAKEVRALQKQCFEEFERTIDVDKFDELMERLGHFLSEKKHDLAKICAKNFESLLQR